MRKRFEQQFVIGRLPIEGTEIPTQKRSGALPGLCGALKEIFVTAHHLPVDVHVEMQARFQKYTDNAVSKTINMPKEAPKEWVEKTFRLADEKGLKGITIYRDGSKKGQVRVIGKTGEVEGDLKCFAQFAHQFLEVQL